MSLSSKHYRMDNFKVQIAFIVPLSKDILEPIVEQKFDKSENYSSYVQVTVSGMLALPYLQVKDLL